MGVNGLMTHPFVRAQNLETHSPFALTHHPLYLLTSPLVDKVLGLLNLETLPKYAKPVPGA